MEKKLIDYFMSIMPISLEEIEAIVEATTIKHYKKNKKGEILLRER